MSHCSYNQRLLTCIENRRLPVRLRCSETSHSTSPNRGFVPHNNTTNCGSVSICAYVCTWFLLKNPIRRCNIHLFSCVSVHCREVPLYSKSFVGSQSVLSTVHVCIDNGYSAIHIPNTQFPGMYEHA